MSIADGILDKRQLKRVLTVAAVVWVGLTSLNFVDWEKELKALAAEARIQLMSVEELLRKRRNYDSGHKRTVTILDAEIRRAIKARNLDLLRQKVNALSILRVQISEQIAMEEAIEAQRKQEYEERQRLAEEQSRKEQLAEEQRRQEAEERRRAKRAGQAMQRLQMSKLSSTVWKELCEQCPQSKVSYIRFRPDGTFGSNSSGPDNFLYSERKKWKVAEGRLTIDWTGHFVSEYRLGSGNDATLVGRIAKSKAGLSGPLKLVRVDPARPRSAASGTDTRSPAPASQATAHAGQTTKPPEPARQSNRASRDASDLAGTVWKWTCERCAHTKIIFLLLKPNGDFGYARNGPRDFKFDGTDKWRFENNKLRLSWTHGYSVEEYVISDLSRKEFVGTKSNVAGPVRIELLSGR